jgi:hypothetical protein
MLKKTRAAKRMQRMLKLLLRKRGSTFEKRFNKIALWYLF